MENDIYASMQQKFFNSTNPGKGLIPKYDYWKANELAKNYIYAHPRLYCYSITLSSVNMGYKDLDGVNDLPDDSFMIPLTQKEASLLKKWENNRKTGENLGDFLLLHPNGQSIIDKCFTLDSNETIYNVVKSCDTSISYKTTKAVIKCFLEDGRQFKVGHNELPIDDVELIELVTYYLMFGNKLTMNHLYCDLTNYMLKLTAYLHQNSIYAEHPFTIEFTEAKQIATEIENSLRGVI